MAPTEAIYTTSLSLLKTSSNALEKGVVAKETPRNKLLKFVGYDEIQILTYHMGEKGHNVDNCLTLNKNVQVLIDNEILTFDGMGLNVPHNPLFEYQEVSMVYGEEEKDELKFLVDIAKLRGILNSASSFAI